MSSEEVLIQTRKDKHQEANGGTYPLASDPSVLPFIRHRTIGIAVNDMAAMQSVGALQTTIDPQQLDADPKYMVAGRITAFRKSGAITFIKLADSTGAVQVIVSKAAYQDYDSIKLFDLGDIIEVGGRTCLSKTGEKSLLAFSLRLLTKSHRPPPEKFNGIADQELKYRKRYLDLMSNEESRARFTVRTYILRAIRQFMEGRNFLEVETSTLNTIASGANAKPFTTHHNALDIPLRLRIAPELYLKRLLVGGLDRVYEIGRNYRNEGIDTRHNPEFTMMESYQAYGNFPDLITFTKCLLRDVREYCRKNLPANIQPIFDQWDKECPFSLSQCVETPMWDAVIHACSKAEIMMHPSIHPLIGPAEEVTNIEITNLNNERLQKIDVKSLFHQLDNCPTNGDKIYAMFEHVVEPFLTEDYRSGDGKHSCPVFITQYPKSVSPLARAHDRAPTLCERFELFIEGRELANAFQELNDPDEQARRFIDQLDDHPNDAADFDHDYVEALEYGMPPAIGFGMGIDRLVMLMTNTSSIKDVILFPTLKPLK
jgi:lysyl-tRNA synthetase class 2